MTTYKGINGFTVQSFASDPVALAAWESKAAMNTGRNCGAGLGTSTAALAASGANSGAGYTALTEEYNGTAWSEEANVPTAMTSFSGAGLQTAGILYGGYNAPPGAGNRDETEHYNGTAWTGGGAMGTLHTEMGGCGTETAALAACGHPSQLTTSEMYNGSTWASGGTVNNGREKNTCWGTQTAGVVTGDSAPSGPGAGYLAEEYDGTSWSNSNEMNTGRMTMCEPGGGTQTAGIIAGGSLPANDEYMETYDGTSFSVGTVMPSYKQCGYGTAGAPAGAYLVTGGAPGYLTTTFLYSENSEPNTFLNEGQVWYNSTGSTLKFYNGTAVKTVTVS